MTYHNSYLIADASEVCYVPPLHLRPPPNDRRAIFLIHSPAIFFWGGGEGGAVSSE